jgi:hypothetical protein
LPTIHIVEGRELDDKWFIALLDIDFFGLCDVTIHKSAIPRLHMSVYPKLGETEIPNIKWSCVDGVHDGQASWGTKGQLAKGGLDGSIEIELGTDEAVLLIIIGEDARWRIEEWQPLFGGNPQDAAFAFHDTPHAIIGQAIGRGIAFEGFLARLVHNSLI